MEYLVISRKYRPQTFAQVLGQAAIVSTLKNALRLKRTAHAYLFSGPRGSGKTTLARVYAKALNCANLSSELEPCNACSSCLEITQGSSLDVIEIDGASNRGIEDIRKIKDTSGYATAYGENRIYIVDEVHMLTKEAFNALLKLLEEPPEKVKFFFATTEPHKVLPTILSRCQHFRLQRIPSSLIVKKLQEIARDLKREIEEEALHLISNLSDGAFRDAESLLDQALAFCNTTVTSHALADVLGVVPQKIFFEIDQAARTSDLLKAFTIAEEIYAKGKDLSYFLLSLIEHYRTLLLIQLTGIDTPLLCISEALRADYLHSASLYTKEECLSLVDYLMEMQQKIRSSLSTRIALEGILTHILRIHQRLPIETLVKKLQTLEQTITKTTEKQTPPVSQTTKETISPLPYATVTVDPTPAPHEITRSPLQERSPPNNKEETPLATRKLETKKEQSRYNTLLQFAAVELEGTVRKL